MTPVAAIAMLDRQLARHGQTVTYQPMAAGAPSGAGTACRAFVRGLKPDELVGDLTQKDRNVTLSPSSGVVPVESARIVDNGKPYRIQMVETIRMDDRPVRYDLVVRG